MYPEYKIAREEGFEEIAKVLEAIAFRKNHERRFKDRLAQYSSRNRL